MNNTTAENNATVTNTTADVVDESGMLDTLMDSPELMVCAAIIALLVHTLHTHNLQLGFWLCHTLTSF